ncbi:MAG TPA: caspase family protein [bacterium]|nr:caspase family protein [bacterium]
MTSLKKFISFWALLLGCLLSANAARASVHRIALIVGNNQGSDTKPFLRYAEQDAKNLSAALKQVGGFAPADVHLLLDQSAGDVMAEARSLQSKTGRLLKGPDDQVLFLFYYSGHSEGDLMELGPSQLNFPDLYAELKKIPSTARVLILDTCQSGRMIQTKGGIPIPPLSIPSEEARLPKGEVFITSSMPLEDSIESSEFQGSLFTQTFISGLRGAADFDLDGRVSLNEALSFAGQYTPLKADAVQKRQHPTYDVNLSGAGEIYMTQIMAGAPLLFLSPPDAGTFLIYERSSRALIAEVPKKTGAPRYVALPVGDLSVRKTVGNYYQDESVATENGGLYYFHEDASKRVKLSPARRIFVEGPQKTSGAVTLHEGESVRLRLKETVSTKTAHAGDQIRLEAAEDVYVNGRLVITAGSAAKGEVEALRKKRGIVHGELVCRLGYVQAVDGQWVPLEGLVSRSPSGLKEMPEGTTSDPLSPTGSDTEKDIASGLTAFFFLPFYPLFMGRDAVLQEGTLFEAFVARDTAIR